MMPKLGDQSPKQPLVVKEETVMSPPLTTNKTRGDSGQSQRVSREAVEERKSERNH